MGETIALTLKQRNQKKVKNFSIFYKGYRNLSSLLRTSIYHPTMCSKDMNNVSIAIPICIFAIVIILFALALYYEIKHTYRDGGLWK